MFIEGEEIQTKGTDILFNKIAKNFPNLKKDDTKQMRSEKKLP
jgi:hypothetical protein